MDRLSYNYHNNTRLLLVNLNGSKEQDKRVKEFKKRLRAGLIDAAREVISSRQIRTSVNINGLKLYNLRQVQYMAGHRFVSST